MPNKTRKQKHQKGGAIPFLPRALAPITGKPENTLIQEFFTNNKIFYVTSHGNMLSKTKFEVPANTYILHAGVSGKVCGEDTSMIDLLQGEGYNSAGKKKQFWKFLTGQLKGQLYNNLLYNPRVFTTKRTLAIYAPGDKVNDMNLSFLNLHYASGYIEQGVYEYPTPDSIFTLAERLRNERERLLTRKRAGLGKVSNQTIEAELEAVARDFSAAHDKEFHDRADNKIGPYFRRGGSKTLLESDLLNIPELAAPATGFRLFIVFSCRGIADVLPAEKELAATHARRASISLRDYNNNANTTEPNERMLYNISRGVMQGRRFILNEGVQYALNLQKQDMAKRAAVRNYNAYVKSLEERGPVNSALLTTAKTHMPENERRGLERFNQIQQQEQESERRQYYLDVFKALRDDMIRMIQSEVD